MKNFTEVPLDSSLTTCSAITSFFFTVALSVISAASSIGNAMVVITFIKTRSLRTSTNYYIVNMAVSDLLCPFFNWPLYITEGMLAPNTDIIIRGPWASPVCKLGMYLRAVSQVVSVLSLVLIALDRYGATVHPLKVTMLSVKIRVVFLALSWLIPLLFGLPYTVFSRVIKEGGQTFCRLKMSDGGLTIFHAIGISVFYLVPLITIIILFSMIMRVLRKRSSPFTLHAGQENVKRCQQNQKILKVSILIVVTFFICWTPICIYLFLQKFYPTLLSKDRCKLIAGFTFYVFPSISTAVNPVILFAFSTNYKDALNSLFSQISGFLSKCKVTRPKQSQNVVVQDGENLEMAAVRN